MLFRSELNGCLAGKLQLGIHTAADIEHHADRQRRILAGKIRDRLFRYILEKPEVLFLKPEDEPVGRVCDRHRNQHQGGLGIETRRGLGFLFRM